MKSILEKIATLSLSLMLVSTFAVSPALPQMIASYGAQGYDSSQVELLISLPSFAIMVMLLVNNMLARYLSERSLLISGLLLLALGGSLPVLLTAYPLVFASRLLLGMGIGLINARAISIISQRYQGRERLTMLGYRGSTEVLGSALLTMLVGYLLDWGWQFSFSIYGISLLILGLYLAFLARPIGQGSGQQNQPVSKQGLTSTQFAFSLGLACLAAFVISVNSINTLRLPMIIAEQSFASPAQSSLLLSAMMLMGILVGILFPHLLALLKSQLLALSFLTLAVSLFLLSLLDSFPMLILGALLSGFAYSIILTLIFTSLSDRLVHHSLDKAMTLVLLFCNLGGATASLVLQLLTNLGQTNQSIFRLYGLLSLILTALFLINHQRKNKNKPKSEPYR